MCKGNHFNKYTFNMLTKIIKGPPKLGSFYCIVLCTLKKRQSRIGQNQIKFMPCS